MWFYFGSNLALSSRLGVRDSVKCILETRNRTINIAEFVQTE